MHSRYFFMSYVSDSVKHGCYKRVYGVLVCRVGVECAAVGYDHAHCHGLMPHEACKSCYCGAFHLEVGYPLSFIVERFYLGIQLRIGERHAQLSALRSEKAVGRYGYPSGHVVSGYSLRQLGVGYGHVWRAVQR